MRNKYHFYGMLKFTEKIDTKVTESTLLAIKKIAELEQRSFAGTIRLLIHEALIAREQAKWVNKPDSERISPITSKTQFI